MLDVAGHPLADQHAERAVPVVQYIGKGNAVLAPHPSNGQRADGRFDAIRRETTT